MHENNISQAADLLVETRRNRQRLADLPAALQPETISDAYAVQDAVVAISGPAGGWKVSPASAESESRRAPVLARNLHASPARLGAGELLIAPEIEVEIAVRLSRDLPPRQAAYTTEDVVSAIASIHPALEVLSSRYQDRKAVPPFVAIADSQSNGAVVFGPALENWRAVDFSTVAMTLLFDGKEVSATQGGPSTEVTLKSLVWLANNVGPRSGGLKAGQVVITGARIKPVKVPKPGTLVKAVVAGLGEVSATIE